MQWDIEENILAVRSRVSALLKSCKCITGCTTGLCGCRRKGKDCSVGCECINCHNTAVEGEVTSEVDDIVIEEGSENITEESHDDVEDLLDWVFGEECMDGSDCEDQGSNSED